jgi:hypothetical protein
MAPPPPPFAPLVVPSTHSPSASPFLPSPSPHSPKILSRSDFPHDFIFGAATSAYQVLLSCAACVGYACVFMLRGASSVCEMLMCTWVDVHKHLHVCECACVYGCIYHMDLLYVRCSCARTCMCLYVSILTYAFNLLICIYVCMCMYICTFSGEDLVLE